MQQNMSHWLCKMHKYTSFHIYFIVDGKMQLENSSTGSHETDEHKVVNARNINVNLLTKPKPYWWVSHVPMTVSADEALF